MDWPLVSLRDVVDGYLFLENHQLPYNAPVKAQEWSLIYACQLLF